MFFTIFFLNPVLLDALLSQKMKNDFSRGGCRFWLLMPYGSFIYVQVLLDYDFHISPFLEIQYFLYETAFSPTASPFFFTFEKLDSEI